MAKTPKIETGNDAVTLPELKGDIAKNFLKSAQALRQSLSNNYTPELAAMSQADKGKDHEKASLAKDTREQLLKLATAVERNDQLKAAA